METDELLELIKRVSVWLHNFKAETGWLDPDGEVLMDDVDRALEEMDGRASEVQVPE